MKRNLSLCFFALTDVLVPCRVMGCCPGALRHRDHRRCWELVSLESLTDVLLPARLTNGLGLPSPR